MEKYKYTNKQNKYQEYNNTIIQIRELINSNLDFKDMMNRLLICCSKAVECETAAISIRKDNNWIVNYVNGFPDDIIGKPINDTDLCRTLLSIKTNEPVFIKDTFNYIINTNKKYIFKFGIRSVIIIPLFYKSAIKGVVFLNYYDVQAFSEDLIEFVKTIAYLISKELENYELFEKARLEEELHNKTNTKYQFLLNFIDEGFCIIDMVYNSFGKPVDYKLMEVNPAFELQTGLKNATGRMISELVPKVEEFWLDIYSEVDRSGESLRFVMKSKALKRWYSVHAFKIDKSNSNVAVLFKDITAEEESRRKTEKFLKIQDEIYTNVSHELRTPLNVIFSANQLMDVYLNQDLIDKERLINYNKNIKQNCYRLAKLINNIVDLSKTNSGFLKPNLINKNIVEVVETIVESVKDYVKLKSIRIIFDTDVEDKIIACDPIMIERIILNLISNAVKFSNNNSKIYINIYDKKDRVEISVRDTGIGIDKEHMEGIFSRYYQADKSLARKAEGSGIGLSLVKSMVELHGGKISVDSEIGKGSTFKIELPVSTLDGTGSVEFTVNTDNKIEMLNVEFSDIYE